jgi:hypothetical protein
MVDRPAVDVPTRQKSTRRRLRATFIAVTVALIALVTSSAPALAGKPPKKGTWNKVHNIAPSVERRASGWNHVHIQPSVERRSRR